MYDKSWIMNRAHRLLHETYRTLERPKGADAWALRESWRLARVSNHENKSELIAWHKRCIENAHKLPLHMSMSDRVNKHVKAIMELEGNG